MRRGAKRPGWPEWPEWPEWPWWLSRHRRLGRPRWSPGGSDKSRASRLRGDRGSGTVEAAIAVGALVATTALCVAAVGTAVAHVQCAAAAREAALLAARGDVDAARTVVHRAGPQGAVLVLERGDGVVTAVVTARARVFPVDLRGTATAADEDAGTVP